jgi:hypothetical protein
MSQARCVSGHFQRLKLPMGLILISPHGGLCLFHPRLSPRSRIKGFALLTTGTNGASIQEQFIICLCFMDRLKEALREVLFYFAVYSSMAALIVALVSPVLWFYASQEAAAFNRFTTGPKATTWDALWVEFRVEAE